MKVFRIEPEFQDWQGRKVQLVTISSYKVCISKYRFQDFQDFPLSSMYMFSKLDIHNKTCKYKTQFTDLSLISNTYFISCLCLCFVNSILTRKRHRQVLQHDFHLIPRNVNKTYTILFLLVMRLYL